MHIQESYIRSRVMQHEERRTGKVFRPWICLAVGGLALQVAGCNGLTDQNRIPAGTRDPASWKTPAGAMAMYREAIKQFEGEGCGLNPCPSGLAVGGAHMVAVLTGGEIADELQSVNLGGATPAYRGSDGKSFAIDARQVSQRSDGTIFGVSGQVSSAYGALHTVRAVTRNAIGALTAYAPESPPAFRGRLYTLMGFAEVLLADLYCSGVPLSTMDFEADFTYRPGSTTEQIYRHALVVFDSAIALAGDSVAIRHLASVGKGRALLALSEFQKAADAVRDVPTSFVAQYPIRTAGAAVQGPGGGEQSGVSFLSVTVSDYEGINGRPYRSSQDPRTSTVETGRNQYGRPLFWPLKYERDKISMVTYASGIEARLIEAENELKQGRPLSWLSILNDLRQTFVPSLPALADPGVEARIDTMFAERPSWLFLTAHRQGDLRRLIRQYGRLQDQVFPIGPYSGGLAEYGTAVAIPIPESERINPYFTGCLSTEA